MQAKIKQLLSMIFLALAVSVTAWFCSRTILWAAWIGFLFYSTFLSDPSDLSDGSDSNGSIFC